MNLSLTPKLEAFVKAKVDAGHYNTASEVVREALRLMQEYETTKKLKLQRLKKALAKGEADLAVGRLAAIAHARLSAALRGRHPHPPRPRRFRQLVPQDVLVARAGPPRRSGL